MKPFRKIAIAALAASVAGTALTAGLSASAQTGVAVGERGQQFAQAPGQQFAHKRERGGRGQGMGQRTRGRMSERLFEQFDTDEDGIITGEEIETVRAEGFADADADGNGEISLEEFKIEFLDRSNRRMVRAFQFLDADGDGTVTQAEVDLAANRLFDRLDRDGNDTIERVRGGERSGRGGRGERAERGPRGEGGENAGERRQRADAGERPERHERAERRGSRGPHSGRGGSARMFMGLFDTDGDSTVTRADFDAKRAELFALADTNGSGSFTLEEFGPLWLAVNDRRIVDMFQRSDADGSLGITSEEYGSRMEQLLERADRNGDGVITEADFKRGKKGKGRGKHRG